MHTNTSSSYWTAPFMTIERLFPFSPRGVHWAMLTGLLLLPMASTAAAADFSGSLKGVTITDAQALNKPPQARFTVTSNGSTFSFDASGSTDPDGSITDYQWDFGNGTKGTGATVSATYTPGTYPVTLTVIDNGQGVALTQQRVNYVEGLVIEDAEDESLARWRIFDNDPAGASIRNEYDPELRSRVITISMANMDNGFALAKDDGSTLNITNNFKMQFSLMTTSNFRIFFQVTTNSGTKYLAYQGNDLSLLNTGTYIYYGLGTTAINGKWNTFSRDLQKDFSDAQPNDRLISIDKILIRGSLMIDNIIANI